MASKAHKGDENKLQKARHGQNVNEMKEKDEGMTTGSTLKERENEEG
jgi:hypothetical protein